MDGISIDKLTLEILLKENDVVKRINAIAKAVENLKKVSGDIDKVAEKLNNISPTSTQGGSTSKGGTNKKDKNKSWTEQTYKINKFGQSILAQSVSVKKFNDTMSKTVRYFDEQGKSLKTITTEIDAYGNKVQKIQSFQDNQNKKTPKTTGKNNVNIFATLGKWSYMINMARYYGRSLANIVQLSMNYVETQNLWQVANRKNIAQASEFIDKMSKAYSISEQTLMNYQALFKTMLSSLGDLSDVMSTKLSQQITQMALDFSSLYNVSIADAMTKFQAVLSGQVRPIRSVSGYDITENTIYDIYAKMGGEKTMRQLSQLEKRLLRIYAVFDQMDASGASGDLAKTINSASNQARIMNEQFKEAMTWTGQIILSWLNSVGVFKYINATLMTISQVMKSIAYNSNSVPDNFFEGSFENIEGANDAIDELQGKLLSFDKFEALKSSDSNILGIDPIIEDLINKIDVGLGSINNESSILADSWLKAIGLGEEMYRVTLKNGEVMTYTKEQYEALDDATKSTFTNVENYRAMSQQLQNIADALKSIGIVLGTLIGYKLITKIGSLLGKITGLNTALNLLHGVVAVGLVYTFLKMVEAFKNGEYWIGALCTGILGGTGLIYALKMVKLMSADNLMNMASFLNGIKGTFVAVGALVGGIALFVSSLDKLSTTAKVLIPVLSALAGVIAAIAVAKAGMTWRAVISAGAITAGIGMVVGTLASIPKYAEGGFPEDGLFFANSGEMVGGFSNGKTAVANNDQIVAGIKQGVKEALFESGFANGESQRIIVEGRNIDNNSVARGLFNALKVESARRGGNQL